MEQPLHIDERLEERERVRVIHVLNRWLRKLFPNSAIIARRPGRRSVESQLRQRPHFLAELWNEYGPQPQVISILKTIQWELALPNHNFVPDDPIVLLMKSAYGIDDVFAFQELERRYSVKYQKEELEQIKDEDWTLGQFVKNLLARCKTPTGKEKGKEKVTATKSRAIK